jgi:hypothetical protein
MSASCLASIGLAGFSLALAAWDGHMSPRPFPPHPNLIRIQFIASRLGWVATCLLINDVASILIRADPFYARDAPPFDEQPLIWRFWAVLLFAATSSMNITISHTWYSILVVVGGGCPSQTAGRISWESGVMRILFAGFGGDVMSSYQRPECLPFRSQADMAPDVAEGELFLGHLSSTLNN